jgi:hypothetical protein
LTFFTSFRFSFVGRFGATQQVLFQVTRLVLDKDREFDTAEVEPRLSFGKKKRVVTLSRERLVVV